MKTISCIIPSYNEEKRIIEVIQTVIRHPHVNEIIIVDDGSKDNTKKVIEDFLTTVPDVNNVRLIVHPKNKDPV